MKDADLPTFPLSVHGSSNPLFADFQPHNSNVFSMLDSFDELSSPEEPLASAEFDYIVIGFVRDEADDVLSDTSTIHDKLFEKLQLKLDGSNIQSKLRTWLNSAGKTRTLCHGVLHGIHWSSKGDHWLNPAHEFAKKLWDRVPISIGQSTLDSLRAFVDRRVESVTQNQKPSAQPSPEELEDALFEIEHFDPHLVNQDTEDNEFAQRDRATTKNFTETFMSSDWRFTDMGKDSGDQAMTTPSGKPQKGAFDPSSATKSIMIRLRTLQDLRDAVTRELKRLQWELFASWWAFMTKCLESPKDELFLEKIPFLVTFIQNMDDILETLSKALPYASRCPGQPFQLQEGPTIMFADARSPWDAAFTSKLPVRHLSQVYQVPIFFGALVDLSFIMDIVKNLLAFSRLVPEEIELLHAIEQLVRESLWFTRLKFPIDWTKTSPGFHPSPDFCPHYYYQTKQKELPQAFDDKKQPFFPLYVEWQATYFHIPFEKWSLVPSTDSKGWKYELNTYVGEGHASDARTLDGRDMILPQAAEELKQKYSLHSRERIEAFDTTLPFLSFSMSGFADHLITRLAYGTHLTPLNRVPGQRLEPIPEAISEPHFPGRAVSLMTENVDKIPYAKSVNLQGQQNPFKPVRHGQLTITEMNIIDRFGQVVSTANSPEPSSQNIYPFVSDAYSCGPIVNEHGQKTNFANSVFPDKEYKCAFAQIPPNINQEARLNAYFVLLEQGSYRPIYEQWENPVWGWLVANFARRSLQFFFPDGAYHGEAQLSGGVEDHQSIRWVPHEAIEPVGVTWGNSRFREFIEVVLKSSPTYFGSLLRAISNALPFIDEAPGRYSAPPSIAGRCLALADFGISLELMQHPATNQSTTPNKDKAEPLESYSFPCIIGNLSRPSDGMVAYFKCDDDGGTTSAPNFHTTYSHVRQSDSLPGPNVVVQITAKNAPRFSPHYIDMIEMLSRNGPGPSSISSSTFHFPKETVEKMAEDYAREVNSRLQIFSVIFDPFFPIHIESGGVMPVKALQLSPWTVSVATERIAQIVRAGPVFAQADPLEVPLEVPLTSPSPPPAGHTVRLPAVPGGAKGRWTWLQPIVMQQSEGNDEVVETRYRAFNAEAIPADAQSTSLPCAPQTAVEGYLYRPGWKD